MNSDETIEKLYKILVAKCGKKEARSTIKAMLGTIIDDLEDAQLDVSAKNISHGLQKYLKDFEQASKSEVA